jgi:hypothetical protein
VARAPISPTRARFVAGGFLAAALAVLLIVTLAGGCGSSKKHAKVNASDSPTTQVNRPGKPVKLVLGSVAVQTAGPDVKVPKETQKKLLSLAQTYVEAAVHEPVSAGKLGARYATIFETGVRGGATGADEKALTDTDVGKAAKYSESATPVKVSGLADNNGTLLYLATNFSMKVTATTAKGQYAISRDVEFTYAPSGKSWLVTAYRVKTVRKLPKAATTTTVTAARGGKP